MVGIGSWWQQKPAPASPHGSVGQQTSSGQHAPAPASPHGSVGQQTSSGQHASSSEGSWRQVNSGPGSASPRQPQAPLAQQFSGQFGPSGQRGTAGGATLRQLSPQGRESQLSPTATPQQTRPPVRQLGPPAQRRQLSPNGHSPPTQHENRPLTRKSISKPSQTQKFRLEDVEIDKTAKLLGKGTFGTVYKARIKTDHRRAAVKVIEKAKLKQLNVPKEDVFREAEMMRECAGDTCNIKERFVQLMDFLESPSKYYFIMEFCENGNLQDAAMSSNGGFGEQHVRFLIKQMLESIVFLHSKSICHRDIKPHNFLVCGNVNSQSVKIKLGDFGEAIRTKSGKLLKDQVGTPAFMAPEMHLLPSKSPGYDNKVDVWALGICTVFLLASEYPFFDGNGKLLRHKLIQGDVPLWEANTFQSLFNGFQEAVGIRKKKPSKVAIHLTRRLLAPRPQSRPSASEAMKHDWFQKPIADDAGTGDDNSPLLDMKDFQLAIHRDLPSVMHPSPNVDLAMNMNPSGSPGCEVCRGTGAIGCHPCPHCCKKPVQSHPKPAPSRPVSISSADAWSTVASLADLPQQWNVKRSLSEQARPRTFSGSFDGRFGDSFDDAHPAFRRANTGFGDSFDDAHPAFRSPYTPEPRRSRTMSGSFYEAQHFGDMYTEQFNDMYTPEPAPYRAARYSPESAPYPTAHQKAMAHARRSECCYICNAPSSMLDHSCPSCNSTVCAGCIRQHLARDPRCPHCHDREHNTENMQNILSAHKARDAWQSFWGSVTGAA